MLENVKPGDTLLISSSVSIPFTQKVIRLTPQYVVTIGEFDREYRWRKSDGVMRAWPCKWIPAPKAMRADR